MKIDSRTRILKFVSSFEFFGLRYRFKFSAITNRKEKNLTRNNLKPGWFVRWMNYLLLLRIYSLPGHWLSGKQLQYPRTKVMVQFVPITLKPPLFPRGWGGVLWLVSRGDDQTFLGISLPAGWVCSACLALSRVLRGLALWRKPVIAQFSWCLGSQVHF